MATLTSTGAVNLTSATNWSPSQIPATGDDLIIGADTLTLNADMTLNTITFNHASSRLAFTGTTRTVEATNGWFITGAIATTFITTTITTGVTLTLIGKWTASGSASSGTGIAFRHFAMTGGTLNLRTVGGDPALVLIDAPHPYTWSLCLTMSGGTLNTTGLLKIKGSSSYQGLILMSGAAVFNHNSIGLNEFAGTIADMISLQGSATLSWLGNYTAVLNATSKFIAAVSGNWVGTATVTGDVKTSGSGWIAYLINGTGTCYFNGKLSSNYVAGVGETMLINNGTVSWSSQSRELNSDEILYIRVGGASLVLTGLVLNNYGKFLVDRRAGSVVASVTTQIINNTGAQFLNFGSTVLDDKVLNLTTDSPTLPPVETVAAGEVYGYTGFEKTGTGLIVDPAIIAAASTASMTSVLTEYDIATTDDVLATLQPSPGSTAERSIEDDKPLTFSWPNNTDTVTGEVSIDNGSYVAVAGAISYLREENGKYYYTLAFDAADRPTEEGTARYEFTSGSYTMYATLRTINRLSSDATLAKQEEILSTLQASRVLTVASPNVKGDLVLVQGDTYDGIGNPKAQWAVTADYTVGWAVAFTIRDENDIVIYTAPGTVASAVLVTVAMTAPTGLSMGSSNPRVWKGKFDVQLTKGDEPNRSVKTIALGSVYINEDVTRE